jgi:hypothetical protein
MALPYENFTAEAREKERAARRVWLGELPRLTGEKRFLAESAAAWSQARELGEDVLLALRTLAHGKPADSPEVAALAEQRKMLAINYQWLKRTGVAAQEGAEAAHEIFTPHHLEDELTDEEAKAYKAIRKRNEDLRKAQEAAAAGGGRKRDRAAPYPDLKILQHFQALQQQQLAGFSGAGGAVEKAVAGLYGGGSGGGGASGGYAGGNLNKMKYPCKACGKLGHWVKDGLCKQEDVAAEMARKYTYYQQAGVKTGDGSGMKLSISQL